MGRITQAFHVSRALSPVGKAAQTLHSGAEAAERAERRARTAALSASAQRGRGRQLADIEP